MLYTVSEQSNSANYVTKSKNPTIARQFLLWCTNQDQEYHIAWAGISLVTMAAVFFPLTMVIILLHGAAFGLIIPAMISLILVFTLNLSAQSTRITLPALGLAILIDAIVIIAAIFVL